MQMASIIKQPSNRPHPRPRIELKSTEIQELMGRMPSAIIRMGQGIILIIFVILFVCCLFFTYPNYIFINSSISNVNSLKVVYAKHSGRIVNVYHHNGSLIHLGDTLCMIETEIGKQYTIAKSKGYIFLSSDMRTGNYINPKTTLCAITDTIYTAPYTTLFVSAEQTAHLKKGLFVEGKWEEKQLHGVITGIATYPNPQTGTYLVNIHWNCCNSPHLYPFYKKEVIVKLRLSDTKIWKILLGD